MQTQKLFSNFRIIKMHNYWQLLFKSAATNHIRIQELLKNSDGMHELTTGVDSYDELIKYQKKLRRVTIIFFGAIATAIVVFVVMSYILNPNKSSASSFQWIQNNWGGAASSTPATKTGTTGYVSKDTNIVAQAGGVSLALPAPASTGDSSYTGATGFYRSDATGIYVASGAALTLKKPTGATCGTGGNLECVSGGCAGNVCIGPCDASTVCGQSCVYNDDIYPTILEGTQCWFAENLRTVKYPDGSAITKGPITHNDIAWRAAGAAYYSCPKSATQFVEDCALAGNPSKYGMLYNWKVAMNSSVSEGAQGICPQGWHLPTDGQWMTLEELLGMCAGTGTGCSNTYNDRGTDQGTQVKMGGSAGLNLPLSGYRNNNGGYSVSGMWGYYWTATPYSTTYAIVHLISSSSAGISRNSADKTYGASVRCIKD